MKCLFDLLVFDFDGTLADTIPICIASIREAVHCHTGVRHTDHEIVSLFGLSEEGILERLAGANSEAAIEKFLACYRDMHEGADFFPGIPEMLNELRSRGIKMAIVTGKGEGSAGISSEMLNLREYFEIIMTGSRERLVKHEQIRQIAEREGIPLERTAYVGDAPTDMNAARQAGVTAIGVAWSPHVNVDELRATSPDLLFDTVEAFTKWSAQACGK